MRPEEPPRTIEVLGGLDSVGRPPRLRKEVVDAGQVGRDPRVAQSSEVRDVGHPTRVDVSDPARTDPELGSPEAVLPSCDVRPRRDFVDETFDGFFDLCSVGRHVIQYATYRDSVTW